MKRLAILFVLLCLSSVAVAQDDYCVEHRAGGGVGEGRERGQEPKGLPAYRAKDVDRKAIITERPEPHYTEEARANHVEGIVTLHATLCPAGRVLDIVVVHGLPDGLTEEAIRVAREIKFQPAEKDGRKVAQLVALEYSFRL
jgi:TonB family protein